VSDTAHGTLATPARRSERAPFFQVWIPSFLVVLASGLALFSLNFWITHAPGGGALLGVVVGISSIASIAAVVVCSGAIDRSDRGLFALRATAVVALALGGLLFVYAFGAAAGALAVAAGAYLLIDAATATYMATIETTVADLVPASWPARRTASLVQLQPQVERTVGPILGSALIAAGWLRMLPALALVGVAVTAGLTVRFRSAFTRSTPPAPSTARDGSRGRFELLGRTFADARVAGGWIRRQPALLYLVVIGIVVNLVVFPFYVLLPAFLTEYDLSRKSQALLYGRAGTAYGIGMLVSSGLFARFARRGRHPLAYCTACVLALTAILGFVSASPRPEAIVPSMAVVGVLFVVLVAIAGGAWLEQTPAEMRVRVFSVRRLVVFSSIPLGTSLMGLGGAAFGYFAFFRVLLVVVVAVTVLSYVLFLASGGHALDRGAS
jgi:MFS family permease